MAEIETCFVKGCQARAPWGFGSVLRDTHKSSCDEHRDLLWRVGVTPVEDGGAGGNRAPARPVVSKPAQGSLL